MDSSRHSLIHQVKKGGKKRKYIKVDYETRTKLIVRVLFNGRSIRKAAKEMGMNFSTAKAIIKIFREEGRILKKAEQGEYHVSYKNFEKTVYKLLQQVNDGTYEKKKGKEDEDVTPGQKILTQLKVLLKENDCRMSITAEKAAAQTETSTGESPVPTPLHQTTAVPHPIVVKPKPNIQKEDSLSAKSLPSVQTVLPPQTPMLPQSLQFPSTLMFNGMLPQVPAQNAPNLIESLLFGVLKQRLQAEFQQQLMMKSLEMMQQHQQPASMGYIQFQQFHSAPNVTLPPFQQQLQYAARVPFGK